MKESAIPTFAQVSSGSSSFGLFDCRNNCSMARRSVGDVTKPTFGDHVVEAQVVIFNTPWSWWNSLTRKDKALKTIS
jgi:hypothetical protein